MFEVYANGKRWTATRDVERQGTLSLAFQHLHSRDLLARDFKIIPAE